MSRKRKPTYKQKLAKRLTATRDVELPPAEAVEAYVEVFEWAEQNPEKAAMLMGWDENVWSGILAGMAFPETYDLPLDEVRQAAWQLRAWNILHGYKYTFDWPTPIAMMSEDEIIAHVRQAGLDGTISLASDTDG